MKIYGPYLRPDGRKMMVLRDPANDIKTTQSYPRYLMEQYLGRKLEDWETVDHINEDFTDDRIENYQLLTFSQNAKKSARLRRPAPVYQFVCPVCGEWTEKLARVVRKNRKAGAAGPFCGKKCARRYQLGS